MKRVQVIVVLMVAALISVVASQAIGQMKDKPKGDALAGTTWTLAPKGGSPGFQFQFKVDGTLVRTLTGGVTENGKWIPTDNGFTGTLTLKSSRYTVYRELRAAYTDITIDLKIRTKVILSDGEDRGWSDWIDWSRDWKKDRNQFSEQTNKPPNTQTTKARSTSPDTVAQAMVKALRDNHLVGGSTGLFDAISLEGDEKTALGRAPGEALAIALATTGEYLTDQQKLQGVFMFAGLFASRRPLTPKKVADYLTRFQIIDKATVERWRTAMSKSDESSNSPSLILAGIAFHDFLFEGDRWKNGNPDRAIVRLGSLTKDAVFRWKAAVGSKDEAYGAWSLLAVDSLFVNDTFQPSVFDAAFPIARKLLSAR